MYDVTIIIAVPGSGIPNDNTVTTNRVETAGLRSSVRTGTSIREYFTSKSRLEMCPERESQRRV